MNIKEQATMAFTMWKMNCPTPRAYRWVATHLKNLDTK
jgi:hypothetical protein